MNKISKDEFVKRLRNVHSATGVNGAKYASIKTTENTCTGVRESTGKPFTINLDRLYTAYYELEHIDTATLKNYVNRVQSPSLAILIKANLV